MAVGVRLFPPSPWRFVGSELPADSGRVDLVWEHARVGVVVDEVKVAGLGRVLEDAATRAQVARYRSWGSSRFGDRFCGVRLLALAGPMKSRLYPPVGAWRPLPGTELWFGVPVGFGDRR